MALPWQKEGVAMEGMAAGLPSIERARPIGTVRRVPGGQLHAPSPSRDFFLRLPRQDQCEPCLPGALRYGWGQQPTRPY